MKKSDLDILERVFEKEINGDIYQSNSKSVKRLHEQGYLQKAEKVFGCLNQMAKANGYVLTLLGNMTYCQSERCRNIENEPISKMDDVQ